MAISIGASPQTITLADGKVRLHRNPQGTVHIDAGDRQGFAAALGFCHAIDRGAQIELTRLIGQGRLCECLDDTPANLEVDRFIRWHGFAWFAQQEVAELDGETLAYLQAYGRGFDAGLAARGRPWPYRLIGHRPQAWQPCDSLAIVKLMGYVSLAQHQGDLEKAIIQALQVGVDPAKLGLVFSPNLAELEPETLQLLRKVQLTRTTVPPALRWLAPTLRASNNWAIHPSRSASKAALCACDPHLEVNRLPAIWYEYAARVGDAWEIAISVPGIPGMVMGRTANFAAGFTYGYLDMIDYFVEHCQDHRVRRATQWHELTLREETILRKRNPPVKVQAWRSDVGLLELPSDQPLPQDAFVLAQAHSVAHRGAGETVNRMRKLSQAQDVANVCELVRGISISTNWVVADRQGNIAYQQAGHAPRRQGSGVVALPAWDLNNHWQGLVDFAALKQVVNPPEGFVASANEVINPEGGPRVVNAAAARYRIERIEALLQGQGEVTLAQCQAMQLDTISRQAERYLAHIQAHLPDDPRGDLLRQWDFSYDRQSRAATLFEAIYAELLHDVFGEHLFGSEVWRHFGDETALLQVYYGDFDRVIFDEARWWSPEKRVQAFARAVAVALHHYPTLAQIPVWGEVHRLSMQNLLLPGNLGKYLRAHRGPYAMPGGRATILQSAIYRADGRLTSFCPSWRMVADLGTDEMHTVLAGGASESITSRHYANQIDDWLAGRYHTLTALK